MTNPIKRCLIAGSVLSAIGLTGCVSQGKYDDLQAQNQQLQQQNASLSQELAAEKAQVSRLQGAIKYTVNSDLLFTPGSWQMRPQGKQIIARMAAKLAPTQQNKILVNGYTDNTPVGPELQTAGDHLQPGSVAEARRKRDGVFDFARRQAGSYRGSRVW